MLDPKIFKDYDIRATIPTQLDQEGMYQLGLAFAAHFKPQNVAIGRDMRNSSPHFFNELTKAFHSQGINVIDLGMITTDMSYFAAATLNVDLSLMITASHNPGEDNGLKVTTKGAIPVGGETGLYKLRDSLSSLKQLKSAGKSGTTTKHDLWDAWIKHVLSFIETQNIKPLKLLVDAGNGMGGVITNKIATKLPIQITPMYFEPDGNFPHHLANPLIPENTAELKKRVKSEMYDLGVAWDGDADRVYLIDDQGEFVSGTTLGALLADYLLNKHPQQKVIYNAVIGRVVEEIIKSHNSTPIRWRVGHALLKAKMREENALLAVEHSGHFFFRQNFFCDSGVIALLLALEIISKDGHKLSAILDKYRKYPVSGEINFMVEDKQKIMQNLEETYQTTATSTDWLDGVTVWFPDWWFNVRPSNTQPLLRLNLEVNSDKIKITEKVKEVVALIETQGGKRVEE